MAKTRLFEQMLAVLGRSPSAAPAFADLCNVLAVIARDDARRSLTTPAEVREAISTFAEAVASFEDRLVRRFLNDVVLMREGLLDSGPVREETVEAARNVLRELGL